MRFFVESKTLSQEMRWEAPALLHAILIKAFARSFRQARQSRGLEVLPCQSQLAMALQRAG
jgi:hypothetical protein